MSKLVLGIVLLSLFVSYYSYIKRLYVYWC